MKLYLLPIVIFIVFVVACVVRFAYFPKNVYFAYDQARDFYFASDILKGDIRLIGPPSAASDKLFPGPLSLYIYSLIHLIFGGNPEYFSAFFRLYNALGVFLVYLISSKLFDRKVGILSASFYALSYEQSQYALFMSHQPMAVFTVLLFYLGLTMFLFEKRDIGLVFSLLGLGLSIQFHYVYALLILVLAAFIIFFRTEFVKAKMSYLRLAGLVFFLTILSYIISEIKFGFRALSSFFESSSAFRLYVSEALYSANRFVHDSFWGDYRYTNYTLFLVLLIFVFYLYKSKFFRQGLFLFIWFLGGVIPYLVSGTKGYYYSAAASVSLFILFSSFVINMSSKFKFVAVILVLGILINNLILIKNQNPKGLNLEIVIQPGMLLHKEKKAIDYIYQKAGDKPFAVRALTVPLNINTTWSYLFEWYGQSQYGFLPIWSEKPAEGFPGNLSYNPERSKLPETQFVIIEPTNGIRDEDKEKFFVEESYFTSLIEEKDFGTIVVQRRRKI